MNNLALIERRTINDVVVDGYFGDKQAWFTRTQIGEVLGYDKPQEAIKQIHKRHRERLDLFSRWGQIDTPSGVQDGYLYNERGVLEICRWSRQPVADMVMDKLYDMAISVRDKGYYTAMSDMDLFNLLANKCIDNPSIYTRLNKSFIGSIAKIQLKEEKDEAKWIIREYNRKCKALTAYYNKHLGESGFKEQYHQLTEQATTEIAEKCPHLEVLGLNIRCIGTKSGMKI